MKKSILLFTAVLTLAIHPVAAQDARQRTVETIVQDALALMPIQHQNDFNREMEDLAKAAPQSIQILAQMLQPAEKASNNLVEYALNGVAAYASTHKQYREAVLSGFTMSAPRAADQYARQFLQEQMRYLTGEEDVVLAQHTGAAPYAEQYDKLLKLGENAGNEVVKAVRSKDRAYRMQALKFATDHKLVNAMLAQKIAALYPIVPADAKVDILNWLGDNKVESQKTLLTRVAKLGGETADAALEALGRIGGDDVADVMMAQLGGKNNDAAASALRSYKGDLTAKITEAIDKAQTKVPAAMKETNHKKLIALMSLANDRRIKAAYSQVKALCESTEPSVAQAAREALAGVVAPAQAAEMAQMLDKADANQVPALQKALFASVKAQEPKAQYNTLSGLMKQSTQKERFYPALAETGTDESVAELEQIWSANNQVAALNALKQSTNYKASQALFKAASAGDEDALDKYVDLVNANEQDVDSRCEKLTNAMNTARGTDLKKYILKSFGSTPTLPAFKLVSQYVGDQELGYTAAYAAKEIAAKCVDDIDYGALKSTLTAASAVIGAGGSADDGYAVDEIKKMLAKEEPSPVFVLPEDEAQAGYEVLFDGTNMDKWTGNKEGYTPVNGTIYVSANYGDEGNLYTIKEYRDFVFRFEFCFVRPGVNNGVGIRTPMGVDAAYEGMCESQILDHDDPIYAGLREYQVHGSVYGVIPAKRIKHKPLGEWSTEEIRVEGEHITVIVNGDVIVDGNIREACQGHNVAPDGSDKNPYTVDHRNHPGMFNEKGHIGFLGHGAGIKFRNVRVLDLTEKQAVKGKGKKKSKKK